MRRALAIFACAACVCAAAFGQLQDDPELKERVDKAIENGLKYLQLQQRPNGSFPFNHGETTAIPALVGMAFLSKGCLPGRAPYGDTINRCIDYVLGAADMRDNAPFKGYLGNSGNGRMYAHSIATLFLSEVSGMVDDARQERIDKVLPLAVKVIIDAQKQRKGGDHLGGWRYMPNSGDSDLSCSGWALMALRSARLNGAQIPPDAIEKAVLYILRSQRKQDGAFSYQGNGGNYGDTLTGAAILCLELCGRHEAPEALKGAKYLMGSYARHFANYNGGEHTVYGLYYTAQGLFQVGGEYWTQFAPWMYETWLPKQRPDGSWCNTSNGNENTPIYGTAMVILAFTVPYRQLPIYQRDETVNEDEK